MYRKFLRHTVPMFIVASTFAMGAYSAGQETADAEASRPQSPTTGYPYRGEPACAGATADTFLPDTAVDSVQIPRIVLQADAPGDQPLSCYRIG